jgi:hypothetical protein
MQAGTELRIEEATIATTDIGLSADGSARLDPASPMMATATLGVTLVGLDRAAAVVDGMAMLDPRERRDFKAVLSLVTALGQPATDPTGRSARRYLFAVEPTGRITMNGADIQPIIESVTRAMPR